MTFEFNARELFILYECAETSVDVWKDIVAFENIVEHRSILRDLQELFRKIKKAYFSLDYENRTANIEIKVRKFEDIVFIFEVGGFVEREVIEKGERLDAWDEELEDDVIRLYLRLDGIYSKIKSIVRL